MKKVAVVCLIVLAAVVVFFVARPSGDDLDGLDGEPWIAVGLEVDGKKIPMQKAQRLALQFEKGKAIWIVPTREGAMGFDGPVRVDSSKQPKEIDLPEPPEDPEEKSPITKGIYEVKEGLLVICTGNVRPTEFKTAPGSKRVLWVFKR